MRSQSAAEEDLCKLLYAAEREQRDEPFRPVLRTVCFDRCRSYRVVRHPAVSLGDGCRTVRKRGLELETLERRFAFILRDGGVLCNQLRNFPV